MDTTEATDLLPPVSEEVESDALNLDASDEDFRALGSTFDPARGNVASHQQVDPHRLPAAAVPPRSDVRGELPLGASSVDVGYAPVGGVTQRKPQPNLGQRRIIPAPGWLLGNVADEELPPDRRDMPIDGIRRIHERTSSRDFNMLPTFALHHQLKLLEKYWERFLDEHNKQYTVNTTLATRKYNSDLLRDTESMYTEVMTTIHLRCEQLQHGEHTLSASSKLNEVKLERVKIEKFGNDTTKWTVFKDQFENYIHNNPDLSDSTKFLYLDSHIKPDSEPYETIKGIERKAENYNDAWEKLCARFDDHRKIVDEMVCDFFDIPQASRPSRSSLIHLVNKTNNLVDSLPKFGVCTEHWGPWLVPALYRKLDPESQREWALKRPRKVVAELAPMIDFLMLRADGIEDHNRAKDRLSKTFENPFSRNKRQSIDPKKDEGSTTPPPAAPANQKTGPSSSGISNRQQKRTCPCCGESHQLYSCPTFRKLDVQSRIVKAHSLGVCVCCLRLPIHPIEKCTMPPCECGVKHNRLLCFDLTLPTVAVSETCREIALLATALISTQDKDGNRVLLRTLCDPGSQVSLITESAAQKLRLPRAPSNMVVNGIGQSGLSATGKLTLNFGSRFEQATPYSVTAHILKKVTGQLPNSIVDSSNWDHIRGLDHADPFFDIPGDVDLLLGAQSCGELLYGKVRTGREGEPIAQSTKLGWIFFGALPKQLCGNLKAFHSAVVYDDKLEELVRKFFTIDELPERAIRTLEEQDCELMFIKHTTINSDGQYVVRIPFNSKVEKLGESRPMALRRLFQNEARFTKDAQLKSKYVEFMDEYLSLGHMRPAPPLEPGAPHYYIPHHPAGTKKFRVVFDASGKTTSGVTFNDAQLTGERLQPDLAITTLRFRTHKIALTADIRKMYRMVKVPEDQLDYQRILWRDDKSKQIREYQLLTQTYGTRSAPHSCVRALIKCADDNEEQHPVAAEATRRDFYVDDFVSGSESEQGALTLYEDMSEMLSKGGFELAKWNSNSWQVLAEINRADAESTVKLDAEGENSVLGVCWVPMGDKLCYQISSPQDQGPITKRKVVAAVARLYDPMGLVCPVVANAKCLIQELWLSKCEWDEKLPAPLSESWQRFVLTLPQLESLQIPRWIGCRSGVKTELYGFADASTKAYACAIYSRVTDHQGNIQTHLVFAKSRVAPKRGVTIPRLELCAAHLLSKIMFEVRRAFALEPNSCRMFTDSMIVLYWLSKIPKNAKMYVANRVADTVDNSKGSEWRHVSTTENPADIASRGATPNELAASELWWNGPKWLQTPLEDESPRQMTLSEEESEAADAELVTEPVLSLTAVVTQVVSIEGISLDERYSSWRKLMRVTAWVRRYVHNLRPKLAKRCGDLSADEELDAEEYWVKASQKMDFPDEIKSISNNHQPTTSRLKGLNPGLDANGVLRCNSRLQNAPVPFDTKCPIILHSKCRLSALLVQYAHDQTKHGGNQLMMHFVRQKFWVTGLRYLVRGKKSGCSICVRFSKKMLEQQMGSLPGVRVTPSRVFKSSGVDYLGPVIIKARSGRCKTVLKGYVSVFVCMCTKAVHLEVVSDLTTEAFLAAFLRFSSRRGRIHDLYSDNATTFHGADAELRAAAESWEKVANDETFKSTLTRWHFIPPVSPHHGGLWEAAVKSTKHHLRRVIGTQQLTFEELATLLANVEACLNSRPLTALSDDSSDAVALTPAHFLVGEPLVMPLMRDYSQTPLNHLSRWKMLQRMAQDFWRRWRVEYLDSLAVRTKWQRRRANLRQGDIVVIRDDLHPPATWSLGKIVKTHPGQDGLVRTADVLSRGRIYQRPITKLCLLPTTEETTPSAGAVCSINA